MISRVIEAKPEELRIFLEEAAGVSKYRERRRETELRLKDTRENLLRVDDIRQELEKQLEHLQGQAEVAKRYHELQRELDVARDREPVEERLQGRIHVARNAGPYGDRHEHDVRRGKACDAEPAQICCILRGVGRHRALGDRATG